MNYYVILTGVFCTQYTSQNGLVQDLELMFNNARHYNEEKSQVYEDAEALERVLLNKIRSLPTLDGSPMSCRSVNKRWVHLTHS